MIVRSNSVESQASCANERYLLLTMDLIFAIDVESLFSTYGEKYTHQIDVRFKIIK